MVRGRARFGKFEEEKSEFFTFDSEKVRQKRSKRLLSRIKLVFASYPWWFYYLCYVLFFTLFIVGILLYAFYAPASIKLNINERAFYHTSVRHFVYPISLQNFSNNTRREFWSNYIKYPTDALDPDFINLTPEGPLPASYNGTPVWQRFRSVYSAPIERNKKQLVLILSNIGLHKEATEIAIDTGPEVVIELNPYADFLGQWLLFARSKGHEVLLEMPTANPIHKINFDPGPLGINMNSTEEPLEPVLNKLMAVTTGYIGFSIPFRSKDSISLNRSRAVFDGLNNHSLVAITHGTYLTNARAAGLRQSTAIDWQFFNYTNRDNTHRKLDDLTDFILQGDKRTYVARIDAYRFSIEIIVDWIANLDENIQLIPLTYLYDS